MLIDKVLFFILIGSPSLKLSILISLIIPSLFIYSVLINFNLIVYSSDNCFVSGANVIGIDAPSSLTICISVLIP